jgi:hypothetical protein
VFRHGWNKSAYPREESIAPAASCARDRDTSRPPVVSLKSRHLPDAEVLARTPEPRTPTTTIAPDRGNLDGARRLPHGACRRHLTAPAQPGGPLTDLSAERPLAA